MARQVELIATSSNSHYLLFGMNANELSTFSLQMWITKYGKRAVDWLQSLSLGYASFMGGSIYLHNDNSALRCNLFGEQKYSEVGVVVNQDAPLTKVLDSIGIFSDGEWEVVSVTIPADKNYPDGMYSRIPQENFKKREGVLYSEFLRNMKTSGGTISAVEALNGEALRGNTAYLILRNTSTDKVTLSRIDIKATKSR